MRSRTHTHARKHTHNTHTHGRAHGRAHAPAFVATFPPIWQLPFAPKSKGTVRSRSAACRVCGSVSVYGLVVVCESNHCLLRTTRRPAEDCADKNKKIKIRAGWIGGGHRPVGRSFVRRNDSPPPETIRSIERKPEVPTIATACFPATTKCSCCLSLSDGIRPTYGVDDVFDVVRKH